MTDIARRNFGLLIAYVLPGFVVLFGFSLVSPVALSWLRAAQVATGPSVGAFLYAFLSSVGGGVTVSAVRWMLLDRLHQLTGIKRPQLDLAQLEDRLNAFERVVEDHYRYYEFYGGMLISSLFTYTLWRSQHAHIALGACDLLFFAIETIFAMASRDALRNYYGRAARVLGTLDNEVVMTNGSGHHEDNSKPASAKAKEKELPAATRTPKDQERAPAPARPEPKQK